MGDGWPAELRRLVEVLVLTSFAIAQPLLDITGRNADFFVYHRVGPPEVVAYVGLVVLGPPLALWALGLEARRLGVRGRRLVHLGTLAALLTAFLYQVGKHAGLEGGLLAVAGALAGVAAAVFYVRAEPARRGMAYATPAPLVFVLLFVFTTPAGTLLRGDVDDIRRVALAKRPPIVMVFLDEFPLRALLDENGQVEERLFPNFARLARGSTMFDNATGTSGWTPYAVPAMLSGRAPMHRVAPSYTLHDKSLFTLLAGQYDIRAFESISQLCPPAVCDAPPPAQETGLAAVLAESARLAADIVSPYRQQEIAEDQFEEPIGDPGERLPHNFRYDELRRNQPERFTQFMEALGRPSSRPTLHFLHLLLPHRPHHYLPSGYRYLQSPQLDDGKPYPAGAEDPLELLLAQRLIAQLAYTDGLLGQLLDELHRAGLWEDALFVLTADHGLGMDPADLSRRVGSGNAADLAWVPMFLKLPGQRAAARDSRNFQHLDLLPTIADALDLRVPWRLDGVSALGPARRTASKHFYDTAGSPITIDGAKWGPVALRGMAPEVVRAAEGFAGVFRSGPHADLVGTPVAGLTVRATAEDTVKVGTSVAPRLRLADGVVPAMAWGSLLGEGDGDGEAATIAVAVNGVIGAVAQTFPGTHGPRTFGALMPDRLFRDGLNAIAYYEVEPGDTVVLRPLRAIR